MNKSFNFLRICDVTLRDGIQNLKNSTNKPFFNNTSKINIIDKLFKSNISNVEIGSNVSKKIIEMSNTRELVKDLDENLFLVNNTNINNKDRYFKDKNIFVLVPNYKKFLEVETWDNFKRLTHLSLITACSETFLMKNTNSTIQENLLDLDKIIGITNKKIRLYVSTCFGCPFEGKTNLEHIQNLGNIFHKYSNNKNVEEIVISDTIGSYDKKKLELYLNMFGSSNKVSLHIHTDFNDENLPDIINKYKNEIISIDTSLGNIGGCPSVENSKLKPNLSTYKIASIINHIENKEIYDLEILKNVDRCVRNNIVSNINL